MISIVKALYEIVPERKPIPEYPSWSSKQPKPWSKYDGIKYPIIPQSKPSLVKEVPKSKANI